MRTTWSIVQDRCTQQDRVLGQYIFRHLFSLAPEFKRVFGLSEEADAWHLSVEHPMQRHFRVFTNVIDLMVRNIGELDMQIAPALITYGRRHFYKHHVGFTPEYISVRAFAW